MSGQVTYGLCRLTLASEEEVAISPTTYRQIQHARKVLSEVASLEEKFFVVCESFKGFEHFVFTVTLDALLYEAGRVSDLQGLKTDFGRNALSFVASARLYVDSVCRHAETVSEGALSKTEAKGLLSDAYDRSYSYRVVEAVRNYAQHRAFPVHKFSIGGSWNSTRTANVYSADFKMTAAELGKDKKFKAEVLTEIVNAGGVVDLKHCIRSYFAALCEVHTALRAKMAPYRGSALKVIARSREDWLDAFPGNGLTAVAACELHDGQLKDEDAKVFIDPQVEEYREHLEARMRSMTNMGDRRVAL